MKQLKEKFNRLEFEYRIFVSLGIVAIVCFISFGLFTNSDSLIVTLGKAAGIPAEITSRAYFLFLSGLMAGISILRMWSGSILSSKLVMSFKVRSDTLIRQGPYILVRNPIYLSDFAAMTGFSLCFPLPGILLPLLFYVHYIQLIKYEEESFSEKFKELYSEYAKHTPRLLPSISTSKEFLRGKKNFFLSYDGIRHNALYLLFIPGLIVAALFDNFGAAVLIGLPGVLDWAVVHTNVGYTKPDSQKSVKKRIRRKKVFEDILYSSCWEDPQTDRAALNINNNDVVFSITSGGCNVLAFLIDNPQKVTALDLNPYQNYLLELKISAFRNLTYDELLEFLGIRESSKRESLFNVLKHSLSEQCLNYWEKNLTKITKGIIHCGRYEKYMALIRRGIYLIMGKKLVYTFFNEDNPGKRRELFNKKWDNLRWKFVTGILLSRKTMTFLFDKAFFLYLGESFSFGKHFAEKARHALTELPVKENYFLAYILLGKYYSEEHLPVYLRKENFNKIKSRLNRIQIVTDTCLNFFSDLDGSQISKFNFSNIFEWMPEDQFAAILNETIRISKEDAVLVYRNLLVKRECPELLSDQITGLRELSKCLNKLDLSFIYNNYVVEKIYGEKVEWDLELMRSQAVKS